MKKQRKKPLFERRDSVSLVGIQPEKEITAHLTCEICGDTWFRDMREKQLADYMTENVEANFRRVTDPNDGTYVDVDGVICDGCEDFYNDEYALAEDEEIEAQYFDELKEDACAAAGTGEFAIWHFDPELGDDK